MATHKISAADMADLRRASARKVKAGMSPKDALKWAIDQELGKTQKQLESVREQAKPPSTRDIDFTLIHETD